MKITALLNVVLATVLLSSIFLIGSTTSLSTATLGEYDPWVDLDDDGSITILDAIRLANVFGTSGTPINKTELLLELLSKIDSLNASLVELESRVHSLELMASPPAVGHWKFDDGTGLIAHDSSGNNNDGVIYNASWTDGILGSALCFDGIDSYVEIPDNETLDCAIITVEAWVKVNGTTGDHQIVVTKWYYEWSYTLEFNPDGTTPQFVLNTAGLHYLVSSTSIPIGSWAHLAATYDGSEARIYINGTLAGSTPVSGNIASGNSLLCVGSHSPVATGDRNWFKGIIDDVRIYNRALSQDEIITDMNG